MPDLRQAVVLEAREWLGTPFVHKQRKKQLGTDCLGFIWSVGENAGASPRLSKRDVARFWSLYGRRPDPEVMREALSEFLVEIPAAEARTGDIVWMHWGNELAVHLAILAERFSRATIIHAINMHAHEVVEHGFTAEWQSPERVSGYWRYPRIAEAEA